MPFGCEDHVGRVTPSVQLAAVLPLVATCVVKRSATATCHAEPVQYCPSGRRRVKVVLFAFRPAPPLLSAALPLKLAGTVVAENVLPFAGAVTEAVIGLVLSSVKVMAVPLKLLPTLSVAVACKV